MLARRTLKSILTKAIRIIMVRRIPTTRTELPSILKPPAVFPRYDDFILELGAIADSQEIQDGHLSEDSEHKLVVCVRHMCEQLLAGLVGRPVGIVVTSPDQPPPPDSVDVWGKALLGVQQERDIPPELDLANSGVMYDFLVNALTSRPRRLPLNKSLWKALVGHASDRFGLLLGSPGSAVCRALASKQLLSSYPGGDIDQPLADFRTAEVAEWLKQLDEAPSSDSTDTMLRQRLATRMKASYMLLRAAELYLVRDSHVEAIDNVQQWLRSDFGPDATREAYASRCEFYSYLCKKMAFTDVKASDTHARAASHIAAIEALASGIATFPRPRLAKYIADHVNCLADLWNDQRLELASRLIYTYWYCAPYMPGMIAMLARIQADHCTPELLKKLDSEAFAPEWQELEQQNPMDINPASLLERAALSSEAAAIRDLHAGALHNYKLLKGAGDEAAAFCRVSGMNPLSFASGAGELVRTTSVLHYLATHDCIAAMPAEQVRSITIASAWDVAYPLEMHRPIAQAAESLVTRLKNDLGSTKRMPKEPRTAQ